MIRTSSVIMVVVYMLCSQCCAQNSISETASKKTTKLYAEVLELRNAGQIDKAIAKLEGILQSDPQFIDAPLTLAGMYYEREQTTKAALAFERVIALDSFHTPRALYSLGRIYLQTSEFTKARQLLQRYLERGNPEGTQKANAEEYLEKARIAEALAAYPVSFDPELLPGPVNTEYSEALPAFTVDGQYLLFTRNNGQEDLYIAYWDSLQQTWISPEPMKGVNTSMNEGAHTISGDGSIIAFTGCSRPDGAGSCDIYLWERTKGVWKKPRNAGGINAHGWDGHPALTADGHGMYFSSDRAGGSGKKDIWYTERLGGRWTIPVNLGNAINSAGNEESPFLFFDSRTLYFMSDGHPGMGDYDIFFATKSGNTWTTPKNLGYPINTIGREGALAIHPDREYAYFTSDRERGQNDIYRFKLDSTLLPPPVSNLQGIVYDAYEATPVIAEAIIYDLTDSTEVFQYTTDADGKFSSVIVHGRTYGIHVTASGYAFWSGQIVFATTEPYGQKTIDVQLIPLKNEITPREETPVVLRNIVFATGSATLLRASLQELKRLHTLLSENSELQIEIRGHTDNVGSEEDNQVLSEARAEAVYDWLIANGISGSRLSYKGFGESSPIASNETEEERQLNRRTEFIMKN